MENYDKYSKVINTHYDNLVKYYQSKMDTSKEKLYNSVFDLGLVRDKRIALLNQKIKNIKLKIEKINSVFVFQKNDLVIKPSNLINAEKNVEIKIKKLTNKIARYNKQVNNIKVNFEGHIKNVRKIIEGKNIIFNKKFEKYTAKTAKRKNNILESNIKLMPKIRRGEDSLQIKYENKINQLIGKKQIEYQKLESLKQKNNVGPYTYVNKKEIIDKKFETKVEEVKTKQENAISFPLRKLFLKAQFRNQFESEGLNKKAQWAKNFLWANKLILILFIFSMIVGILNPNFFKLQNWIGTLNNNAPYALLAIGMTFIILTKGIDLSVGSVMAVAGATIMTLMKGGMNPFLALLCGVLISILIGIITGFLIGKFKIVPFIVTLVGLIFYRGLTYIILDGKPVYIQNDVLTYLGTGYVGVLPIQIFLIVLALIVTFIILKFTVFGRHVYAVGSNEQAAQLAGVKCNLVKYGVYGISGLFAGLAALIFLGNVNTITPTTGNAYELEAIAAVVLGGTSLNGGKGGVMKTFIGFMIISIISNALVMLDFKMEMMLLFKAGIILIAAMLDREFVLNLGTWKNKIKSYYRINLMRN